MTSAAQFVFLHGGGQGSWIWAATQAALAQQAPGTLALSLALDVPGCGRKRDRATSGLALEDVARELIGDIERAGGEQVVVVGHSQGGQAMALMAEMRPALFHHLVYLASSIPLPGQTVLDMLGDGPHGRHPDEVGWPFDPATVAPRDRPAIMFCNDMDAADRDGFLARLGHDHWPAATYAFRDWPAGRPGGIPATFIACLRDAILPLAWQERFAGRFGAGRVLYLDAGHQAMLTRPHALAETLWAIVDGKP